MIKKSAILLTVLIMFTLLGCPDVNDTEFSYDPDPVDDPTVLPSPAEDLYIVANIGGEIYGFDSSDPLSYTKLATDASIEEYFSEIRISPNLEYLLYARDNSSQSDLVLVNLLTDDVTVITADIASNESEFIDNDYIQYSTGGRIRKFNITTGADTILVSNDALNCNHGGQVSPDGNELVFKNQDPSQSEFATIAWSDNIPTTSADSIISYSGTILLEESFDFTWRDDNRVIFKPNPGSSYRLFEKTLGSVLLPPALLSNNGTDVNFEKLIISPDKENLLIYGLNGLYMLDLVITTEISGTIEPAEIYTSDDATKFAAFGSNSLSFVVGTENWMGIYNTEGLEKTNVSIENIFGDSGTLYALHCR